MVNESLPPLIKCGNNPDVNLLFAPETAAG